jgi:ribosomal protection tetracycline resistance protein
MAHVRVELPADAIGAVAAALARLGAAVETPSLRRQLATIDAELSTTQAQELQRRLPGLTGGEGVVDSSFAGYRPVSGEQPVRHRREAESHV